MADVSNLETANGFRLSHFADEISAIANDLGVPVARKASPRKSLVEIARDLYEQRRARNDVFETSFFGEPAWDILLDLFIETQSGRSVDITSATIASCVPPTTALRWICVLEMKGLIIRKACKNDRRRSFLRFTEEGLSRMQSYLSRSVFN